jgi:hypothetical protein
VCGLAKNLGAQRRANHKKAHIILMRAYNPQALEKHTGLLFCRYLFINPHNFETKCVPCLIFRNCENGLLYRPIFFVYKGGTGHYLWLRPGGGGR